MDPKSAHFVIVNHNKPFRLVRTIRFLREREDHWVRFSTPFRTAMAKENCTREFKLGALRSLKTSARLKSRLKTI